MPLRVGAARVRSGNLQRYRDRNGLRDRDLQPASSQLYPRCDHGGDGHGNRRQHPGRNQLSDYLLCEFYAGIPRSR